MLEIIEIEPLIEAQGIKAVRILLARMADINPNSVEGIGGIKIFERTENLPLGMACFDYLFKEANFEKTYNSLINPENKLRAFEPGAIVQYFRYGYIPTHIGVVLPDGNVRSKWGILGHVYDHPPRLVPYQYGNTLEYFRAVCIL